MYDDEDWKLMCSLESGTLICPEPGCSAAFKKPLSNHQGTRWLANLPGGSCGHTISRVDLGGGPMSAEHRWLQSRLARICEALGFEAITEHYDTNSDVYVPAVRYSLEVQRWSTAFATRTAKRLERGHMVWFVTEGAKGKATTQALFTYPAVRLAVVSQWDRTVPLKPWEDPATSADARLRVFATVARLDSASGQLRTRSMDAKAFLREVLTGQRLWYPRGTVGAPGSGGFWAKAEDLESARAARPSHLSVLGPTPKPFASAQHTTPEPEATPWAEESDPSPRRPTEHVSAVESVQIPSSTNGPTLSALHGPTVAERLPNTSDEESCTTMMQPPAEETPRINWWRRMFHWLRS